MTKRVAFPKNPSEPKTVGVRHGVGICEDHFRAASGNVFFTGREKYSVVGDASSASRDGICLYV